MTEMASTVNRFEQSACKLAPTPLRGKIRAAANSGFKKLAVQWLIEVQFFNQTFVQVDSFVLRNRQLLKPANRCLQCRGTVGLQRTEENLNIT